MFVLFSKLHFHIQHAKIFLTLPNVNGKLNVPDVVFVCFERISKYPFPCSI